MNTIHLHWPVIRAERCIKWRNRKWIEQKSDNYEMWAIEKMLNDRSDGRCVVCAAQPEETRQWTDVLLTDRPDDHDNDLETV